jgi:hypothetical protein
VRSSTSDGIFAQYGYGYPWDPSYPRVPLGLYAAGRLHAAPGVYTPAPVYGTWTTSGSRRYYNDNTGRSELARQPGLSRQQARSMFHSLLFPPPEPKARPKEPSNDDDETAP